MTHVPGAGPVLLVDDDARIRSAMSRLLEAAGYDVEAFSSAADLLRRESLSDAACLILDVRMPGMDGIELQSTLRALGLENAVIFMSGQSDVPTSVSAMKGGALDFLVKPVDERPLLLAVEQAIARGRASLGDTDELARLRRNLATLTPREREVCALVASGRPNKQIAALLGTTEKTVKVHRARAITKLEAHSLAELVRIADRLGLKPTAAMQTSTPEQPTPAVPMRPREAGRPPEARR